MKLRYNNAWVRDTDNPILSPLDGDQYDNAICMNPWIMQDRDEYRLYYAGAGRDSRRRICLASAPVDNLKSWTRHGPLFDLGPAGSFDEQWCVLPHVIPVDEKRTRVYYTGNSGRGRSLERFPGIGFADAVDDDSFVKDVRGPVLVPSLTEGAPDSIGIAGGSVLIVTLPNGLREWRFYYTGCPTVGDDVFLDQQKIICLATSADGVQWNKRGAVMRRDPLHDYEDIAVAGPVVQQRDDDSFQMWYSAIGTRWGYYSICYAESPDGLEWHRGEMYGDNLQLGPRFGTANNWEAQMVEYPSVIATPSGQRLFYSGNGYGRTGIGTATATSIRATRDRTGAHLACNGESWKLRLPASLSVGGVEQLDISSVSWRGPDADSTIWHEQTTESRLAVRGMIEHVDNHLRLRLTITNNGTRSVRDLRATPALVPHGRTSETRPHLQWQGSAVDLVPGESVMLHGTLSLTEQ